MKLIEQKGASQKELITITLRDKTQLKQLIAIKLEGVKPIVGLQEVKGKADIEKSVLVGRGESKENPLSVLILSDYHASTYGGRFALDGYHMPLFDPREVGAVKDGVLKLYKVYNKEGEISWANYDMTMKIVKELGAELPDHHIAIPAIWQALNSPELSKDQKDAIKNIRFCVPGKDKDLVNLEGDKVYTWDEAKDELLKKALSVLERKE